MATISAEQLKSLYQQLAAAGYNYADIVALAKQYDVTEQELGDVLSGKVTEVSYEEPDATEKSEFEKIIKDVGGKQTEKQISANELKSLVGDIQKAGYSMNDIYNLASQYDVSQDELKALLAQDSKVTSVGYKDPTTQERAQFEAIRAANPEASKAADVIYNKNQTRAELQKLLPDRKISDEDVNYWQSQGGVTAVQKQFGKPPADTADSDVDKDLTISRPDSKKREGTGVDFAGETGLREAYVPFYERLMERASAEADVPFQAYESVSPLIQRAQSGIANLKTPGQFRQGSNLATAAGIGALDYGQYKPTQFTTGTFANPLQGTRGDIINFAEKYAGTPASSQQVGMLDSYLKSNPNTTFQGGVNQLLGLNQPPTGKAYGGEVEGYQTGGDVTVGGTQPDLMNPSLQPINYGGQNVTNVQASYMSPYMQNVVDVQQREAKRQADIANQAIGARAAQAGAFGGTRHGLMEAEANRNLQTQLGGIQAKGLQDAYNQGIGQFNIEQNRGLEAQKLGEQSRQFGAELGLKGLQTGIQAGQALGQLGSAQSASDLARFKTLYDMGTGERTFDYNEFLRAEKYPYENLRFMSEIARSVPQQAQLAAPTGIDPVSQALSGGASSLYLAQLLSALGGSSGPTTTSDRRLKTDIQTLGVLDDGLKVYSYRYKSGGPVQIGVMADEVAILRPQAYIKGGAGDGFDAVDYSKL